MDEREADPIQRLLDLPPNAMVGLVVGDGREALGLAGHLAAAGEHSALILLDILPMEPSLLAPGVLVHITYPDGHVDALRVAALEHHPEAALLLQPVDMDEAGEVNRRAYHRVSMRLDEVRACILAPGHAALLRVRLLDLSGGGARFVSPRPLAPGDSASMRLPLLDGIELPDVRASVVWSRSARQAWQAGARFTNLTNAERDLIVRTVFREELRARREQLALNDDRHRRAGKVQKGQERRVGSRRTWTRET